MASVTGDTRQLPASPPPAAEPSPARHASVAWWLAAVVVAASLSVVVTWPLALHMGQLWSVRLPGIQQGQLAAPPAGSFPGNDALQTMHVNQVVIDNALHLREPFLDLVSGAAGPEPLRTSSLDLPWSPPTTRSCCCPRSWPCCAPSACCGATPACRCWPWPERSFTPSCRDGCFSSPCISTHCYGRPSRQPRGRWR